LHASKRPKLRNSTTSSFEIDVEREKMSVIFNKIFKKYDVDGDGKINKMEFGKICYELGHYFSPDELEIAFGLVDSDGSGVIEKEEFLNFWRSDDRFDRLRLDEKQAGQMAQRMCDDVYLECDDKLQLTLLESW
jgi:hypothetical protein